jgi:hypothetical protein
MQEWQSICCRSRRYRAWNCDEVMFFIPLSFRLQYVYRPAYVVDVQMDYLDYLVAVIQERWERK